MRERGNRTLVQNNKESGGKYWATHSSICSLARSLTHSRAGWRVNDFKAVMNHKALNWTIVRLGVRERGDPLWDKTMSFWDIKNSLSHEQGSEKSEWASERVSGASKRTDERVTQYLHLFSWLIQTTVRRSPEPRNGKQTAAVNVNNETRNGSVPQKAGQTLINLHTSPAPKQSYRQR